ncbi:MAG TPA: hypothetical protein DCX22_00470 [Dehalococcoidia bacterium]|nr:hypothetical protein [Dehalococcoidia bacterium]
MNIGEGTRPDTGGLPGHIRIDAIHQGDLQKKKGVYHINAVDEVTQWEIVASSRELLAAEYHLEDT